MDTVSNDISAFEKALQELRERLETAESWGDIAYLPRDGSIEFVREVV